MSSEDVYDRSFRFFIENRTRALQNVMETAACSHDNESVTALEERIDRESDRFITDVTTRLNAMHAEIKARRPMDARQPDYQLK